MKSKELLRRHIQPLIDAGATQKAVSQSLSFKKPNYLSMLLSDKYTNLYPLDRLEKLSQVCNLNEEDTINFVLARFNDAKLMPVEMSSVTFKYLLTTTAKIVKDRINSAKRDD